MIEVGGAGLIAGFIGVLLKAFYDWRTDRRQSRNDIVSQWRELADEYPKRIAEVEAKNDKLRAELEEVRSENDLIVKENFEWKRKYRLLTEQVQDMQIRIQDLEGA